MSWYEIFPKILNMSVTASIIILFVLLARLCLRKAPKIYSYVLWVAVLFRLLCPVSLSAPVSLLGALDAPVLESTTSTSTVEYVPVDIVHTEYPEVKLPISGINDVINETLPLGEEQLVADPLEAPVSIITYIWILGVAGMAGYASVSYLKLKKKLTPALRLRENIYLADHIPSSFVIGTIRPRIYLSSGLTEKEQEYVILHEQHHIRRCDHIFKVLAFVALSIHWFNPLVWAAFIQSTKDMEMSCDEAVIKKMGKEIRAEYSASLLNLATGQRIPLGIPLAFGEGDTKGRIKNLARWKKPTLMLTLTAVLVCIVVILVCVFNPKAEETVNVDTILSEPESSVETDPLEVAISKVILEHSNNRYSELEGYFDCESHVIFSTEMAGPASSDNNGKEHVTVYAMVLTQTYDLSSGRIVDEGGSHMPVALTFQVGETGEYILEEYWTPMDGSGYEPSIREKFPESVVEDAMDTQKYILAQIQNCYDQAVRYGNLDTDAIVANLLDEIVASPGLTPESGLAWYIQNESITYRELTYYGAYTLKACFQEFLKGGQTDLRGLLMAEVCQDIMAGYGEAMITDYEPANGQEWFNAFKENAGNLEKQYTEDEVSKLYPASAILLELLDSQESVSKNTREEVLGRGQYLDMIDWDSMKTNLTDSEIQSVKKYLPVLEGAKFTWIYRSGEGEEPDTYVHSKKKVSIEEWVREAYEKNDLKAKLPVVDYFVFADVFQSGSENICVLFRHLGYEWLILHEEDGVIYGIDLPVRWFCGVQKDGLYYGSGGASVAYYKRMRFENGDYVEEAVGDVMDGVLYLNGEERTAEEYAEWEANNIREGAQSYYPREE